jgi:hypothetical protein
MRSRRKRVRRTDGSVYVMKTKRERWKSRRVGVNRTIEPTMDWAKQSVWLKAKEKEEKKPLNSNPKG